MAIIEPQTQGLELPAKQDIIHHRAGPIGILYPLFGRIDGGTGLQGKSHGLFHIPFRRIHYPLGQIARLQNPSSNPRSEGTPR